MRKTIAQCTREAHNAIRRDALTPKPAPATTHPAAKPEPPEWATRAIADLVTAARNGTVDDEAWAAIIASAAPQPDARLVEAFTTLASWVERIPGERYYAKTGLPENAVNAIAKGRAALAEVRP